MTHASQNDIKLLRKLRQRKYREREELFFIEGKRAVEQILTNGIIEVVEVYISENIDFRTGKAAIKTVSESDFKDIADTDSPQGILALCKKPQEIQLSALLLKEGVIVVTDEIQDPGNLGTIIRTASWFGAKALIAGAGTVDVFHPKVVRSTAGATGSLPVLSGDLSVILPIFEQNGWQILLLDGNVGATPLTELKPRNKILLVVGNEANGIHKNLFSDKRLRVKIPSSGQDSKVESLNAAIALGIALWVVNIPC